MKYEFSDAVEKELYKLATTLGISTLDTLKIALGTEIFLRDHTSKGHKILIETWPRNYHQVFLIGEKEVHERSAASNS